MKLHYFSSEDSNKKNEVKNSGLMSPEQVLNKAVSKAANMSESRSKNSGLIQKESDSRLLTNDGREIFNENK